ncbi:MAG: Cytochrome c oxidase caa3-type, assembly factor CtaG-related protein [Acidobacteriaceae bacterium]|jgi:putative membrane protein|nr:Cytochrome c oxidase caa3-type, assembly factor CtaG-related protein [Acidobacteriaceae bacterium]
MPLEVHAHVHSETFSPLLTFILVLIGFVYVRGWLRLRSASPTLFPAWRLAAFTSGLVLIWIALGSPLAALDHQLLTIHMLKHLLLMAAGAPLILLGAPALPFVYGLPKYFVRRVLLRSRTRSLLGHFLSNSVFCWLAGAAAVIAWHVPALFQLALTSHTWHIVEDASFLSAGLLFWRPIVRPLASDATPLQWSMPLYLFLATLPCDILSAFLTFCGRVVYPNYVSTARIFSVSPLQDQECAGALMWVFVTFAYLIPAVVITIQILSPSAHREAESALYEFPATEASGADAEVYTHHQFLRGLDT